MKTLLLLVAVIACFSLYAAGEPNTGAWTAELDGGVLQVTIFQRDGTRDGRRFVNNTMAFSEPVTDFANLAASDLNANGSNVQFELRRAAGTIAFDGRFSNGEGAGHFKFTPSAAFVREMDSLGFSGFDEDQLLLFAAHDFRPQTIRDLRAMGYQPTQREIEEIAVFGITSELLREYSRLGFPNLSLRQAVEFRVGHVDAAYIAGMRELGFTDISANKLGNLAVLGVRPAYVRELQAAGLTNLTPRDIENLRVGNITAEKIEQYRKLGYTDLSPSRLGEMGIHGVTPKHIEELRALGYTNIPAKQLIEMKIFGVTPDFIRKMNALGYTNVPADKLIKLKQSGLVR